MAKRGPKGPHRGTFKPGQSGNPGGRSRFEKPWSEALKREVAKFTKDDEGARITKINLLARKCVAAAIAGDSAAIKEIGNRLDGLPAQQQIVTGEDDGPVKHIVELSFRSGV